MNKLRIQRKGIYAIEVNDHGDIIEFDLEDIDLPFKFQRALDQVKKLQAKLKQKITVIDNKKDRQGEHEFMSENEKERVAAYKDTFQKMRGAMDEFLGDGGCQKIFGDRDYVTMYEDLFEALSEKDEEGRSHLDKMRLTSQGLVERIENKYKAVNDGSVLE